jgi:hypothetical protein
MLSSEVNSTIFNRLNTKFPSKLEFKPTAKNFKQTILQVPPQIHRQKNKRDFSKW